MTQFTETTRVGFAERIKSALKGIGLGIGFIGVAVYFLFWNEGNAVRTARALAEGAGRVIAVDSAALDPANDGALVHIGGPLMLPDRLVDAALGVASHAQTVRLERKVEQFAWIEDKRTSTDTKTGGSQEKTTEYTYRMGWTDSPDSGAGFRIPDGHMNPPAPIRSVVLRQSGGAIGDFGVDDKISDLGGSEPLLLTADQADGIASALSFDRPAHLVAGQVVFAANVASPEIGDLRISYAVSDIDEVSAVGVQRGAGLVPYIAENGKSVYLVEAGLKPAQDMFQTAAANNRFKTWMMRAGLMVLLFLGFKAVLSIVDVAASILPFLGWITASVTSLISLALTLIVGGGTMAVAWMFYRPLWAVAIVAVAFGAAALTGWFVRNSAKDNQAQA